MRVSSIAAILRGRSSILAAVALSVVASSAHASTINITVPAFSTASSFEIGTNGTLAGWTNGTDGSGNNAYNFNFKSIASAIGTGAVDEFNTAQNPDRVVLDNKTTADPNCSSCAFLGLDSDYHTGKISATISGLTIGATETITFDFAGSQQTGYPGYSTDFLDVIFGGTTKQTGSVFVPQQGFSGWNTETFTFTANATSETLSFLAGGTQQFGSNNEPAFALLDNLKITQTTPNPTPEPSSLMLLGTGLAGLGGLVRSRFKKAVSA